MIIAFSSGREELYRQNQEETQSIENAIGDRILLWAQRALSSSYFMFKAQQ